MFSSPLSKGMRQRECGELTHVDRANRRTGLDIQHRDSSSEGAWPSRPTASAEDCQHPAQRKRDAVLSITQGREFYKRAQETASWEYRERYINITC